MNKKEKTNKLEGNKDGKVWKKWWFWALIAAVVIGGVIENTVNGIELAFQNTAEPKSGSSEK